MDEERKPENDEIEKDKDIVDQIKDASKKAGFKVLSEEQDIAILEAYDKKKKIHIYGDDIERLDTITKKSDQYDFEEAETLLNQYKIAKSIEDLVYDFYRTYWNSNHKMTISEDMKLRVKGQLKFRLEHLIWSIKNANGQVDKALGNIKFILSEKYELQTNLQGSISKDIEEQLKQGNNLVYFLKNHDNYKIFYSDIIKSTSQIKEMENIEETLEKINNQWSSYSVEERDQINRNICNIRDLGLNYTVSEVNIEALISYYKKLEQTV